MLDLTTKNSILEFNCIYFYLLFEKRLGSLVVNQLDNVELKITNCELKTPSLE